MNPNPLAASVVKPVVKQKKPRVKKSKAEPVVEELKSEPEPELVSLPVVEPEPEPEPALAVCLDCGELAPFTDAEMNIYKKINAYKRKLLRLKKMEFVSVEV